MVRGWIVLIFLVVVAGCRRESEVPSTSLRTPPRPLLRALKLEPLSAQTANHVYRFICSRTFHKPFSIDLRIASDGTGKLTRKMLSGAGGYDLGSIKEQSDVLATAPMVKSFLNLLDQEHFWSLEPGQPTSETGLDGSDWYVEAVRTNGYHIVSRWSPETNTAVSRIGRQLIEMADWKIENLY
jgi:hypothetical protein